MAQIDFSNATIEVADYPLYYTAIGLAASYLRDMNFQAITSSISPTTLSYDDRRYIIRYTGTINAGFSGTAFYLYTGRDTWKISNISYSGGDTFDFTIGATLTCN